LRRKPVATIDTATTATVFDAARECRLFIPIILGSLCGLRRGEITAIRWNAVDLEIGQLAVVASTEQCDSGSSIRENGRQERQKQNHRAASDGR